MSAGLEEIEVTCPYCGERVSLLVESDLRGELVQDCEVCCNPWQVEVSRSREDLAVRVRRLED